MIVIRIAIYLGIGALLHAVFVGTHFDWNSAWTYAWLFAWPVAILIWGGIIVFGLSLIVAAAVGIAALFGKL